MDLFPAKHETLVTFLKTRHPDKHFRRLPRYSSLDSHGSANEETMHPLQLRIIYRTSVGRKRADSRAFALL